ncbi:hypothetical protein [Streptodolium elevatio]
MSSRDLYDEEDGDFDGHLDDDPSLLDAAYVALEGDCEALADALAHCWGRAPEGAVFVSEEVEQAVLTVQTADGTPRYSGFISLWCFPGYWLGVGVRYVGERPPVELVALSGPLHLLAGVEGNRVPGRRSMCANGILAVQG